MMRTLRLSVLLLCCLLLAGCAPKAKKPLAEAVAQALSGMDGMVAMTEDDLEMMTGLTPEDYAEMVCLAAEDGLTAREAIVLRARDAEGAKAAVRALEEYLDNRRTETRDYLPDAYSLLSRARVSVRGLTAALIVGEHSAEETARLLQGE